MTQQKSEDGVVPQGRRKPVPTRDLESLGGGKTVPVKEADQQLSLFFATAENPRTTREAKGDDGPNNSHRRHEVPKEENKLENADPAGMDSVVKQLEASFDKVAANKGAPGPDQQTIAQVERHWTVIAVKLRTVLLEGSYMPGDIRRVWIPKAGGGQRGLGIPNVIDRIVQEAIRRVLEPLYEPTFHPSSHGFRPNRSCHTAIAEARGYVEEGYLWVVDLDLEKFFDRVHRQRLIAKLAQRVSDKRVLSLIDRMLKAKVVLPEGTKVSTEEGLPQGGPLSPLLSNVVLSELDEELAQRGHRFVRYADDCNIYVQSERAGQRVMASVTRFIEGRMRLKVNVTKSAVARPETRHSLGYRLQPREGEAAEILLSERSEKRLREEVRERTKRTRGDSLRTIIRGINEYLSGWLGHFGICTRGIERVIHGVDAHLRRRLLLGRTLVCSE